MKCKLDSPTLSREEHKSLRNKYTKEIRKAKKSYERSQASSAKGGVWDVIRRKTRRSGDSTWKIDIDRVTTEDSSKIATEFRNMFVNKVESLSTPAHPESLIEAVPQVTDTWELKPCSIKEVADIVDALKSSKSCGPDKIPSLLLKELKNDLLVPLHLLVNRCIIEGDFPDCFKVGKVVPVHKKGSSRNALNYRPITITSIVGKVIESAINKQLGQAVDKFLPSTMFGFRKNMGTSDALIHLTDDIKSRRAKGEFVAILICDASAAFDLLSRDLVFHMLHRLGAGHSTIKLIRNFMSNSRQYVVINDQHSEEWSHDVGSGQGHVLSPPLYNIGTISQYYWTKDLSTLYGFADDGSDVISAPTIDECNEKIRAVMNARQRWYKLAGMSLNVQKTMVMGYGFRPDTLTINNSIIEPVTSLKFLGLTLEDNFNFDLHVKSVSDRIRRAAANIRQEGRNFTTKDRRLLYMGWVQGTLCSNGTAYLPLLTKTQSDSLQTSCNAAIRSVANLPRKSSHISITSVRNSLNIMPVTKIAEKLILTHAWKNRRVLLPKELPGPCTRSRSRGNNPQPIQKGVIGKMVSTLATSAFNKLPLDIKLEESSSKANYQIKKLVKQS